MADCGGAVDGPKTNTGQSFGVTCSRVETDRCLFVWASWVRILLLIEWGTE